MSALKVAIVTGAGSGIGRACSLALMKAGFSLVLAGRRKDALEETALRGKEFGKSIVVPSDMTDPGSIAAMFAKTMETFGRLDVIFNNAGMGAPAIPLEEAQTKDVLEVLDLRAEGRLRHIAAGRGAVEAEGVGHGDDVFELAKGEIVEAHDCL